MKAAAFLISLIMLPVALPAHARDWDDLGSWSIEELCENRDKRRHAEAVFAELERRGTFTAVELGLIRAGRIDIGASEAALHCSWGQPRGTEDWGGEPWQVYHPRRDGPQWRYLVRLDSSQVSEISPAGSASDRGSLYGVTGIPHDTFSGRRIRAGGLSEPDSVRSIFR